MKKGKKVFWFGAVAAVIAAAGGVFAWLFKNDKLPFGKKDEAADDLDEDDFDEDLKDLFDDFKETPAAEPEGEAAAEEETAEEAPAEEEKSED